MIEKIWKAIGGRKFLALLLACGVYLKTGTFDPYLMGVFIAFMLANVLAKNPEFAQLLMSGIVGRDEKIQLIDNVIGPAGSDRFTSFLRVLARHDRLELLPVIFAESQQQHEIRSGQRRVRVRSAVALTDEVQNQLKQQLSKRFGFEAILETSQDPELIGGMVIQVGKRRFAKLKLKSN